MWANMPPLSCICISVLFVRSGFAGIEGSLLEEILLEDLEIHVRGLDSDLNGSEAQIALIPQLLDFLLIVRRDEEGLALFLDLLVQLAEGSEGPLALGLLLEALAEHRFGDAEFLGGLLLGQMQEMGDVGEGGEFSSLSLGLLHLFLLALAGKIIVLGEIIFIVAHEGERGAFRHSGRGEGEGSGSRGLRGGHPLERGSKDREFGHRRHDGIEAKIEIQHLGGGFQLALLVESSLLALELGGILLVDLMAQE